MRTIVQGVAAATAMATATLVPTGAAAAAQTSETAPGASKAVARCPAHNVCLYNDESQMGLMHAYSGFVSYQDVIPAQHDEVSSWINANTTQRMCILDHQNGHRVTLKVMPPGTSGGLDPDTENDKADAVAFC